MPIVSKIGNSNIHQNTPSGPWWFRSGAAINADGSPHAYHPQDKGLDSLANAGKPGNWYGIVAKNNGKGEPFVQGLNEPAPGYYVSATALGWSKYAENDQRRYVNSETIPFFVLPGGGQTFGAKLGDIAIAYNTKNNKITGLICADIGPSTKIGEVSIAAAKLLDINSSPKNGGCVDGVLYVVFPKSSKGWPIEVNTIQELAKTLFDDWGGVQKLKQEYPQLVKIADQALTTITEDKKVTELSVDDFDSTDKLPSITVKHPEGTWLKTSVAAAATLSEKEPKQKHFFKRDSVLFPSKIYDDEAGHCCFSLPKSPDQKLYMYARHVLVQVEGEHPDTVGSDVIAKQISTTPAIDPKNNRAAQDQLVRIGLLDPPADGKWGAQSDSAWRAWCRVMGSESYSRSPELLDAIVKHPSYKDLKLKPQNPNDPENVLATKCLQRMQSLGMFLSVTMGSDSPSWNFFYLSGTNPDGTKNDDRIDKMNDLRFIAKILQDGTVVNGGCWVATWDAGWKYRKNRMNPDGCFQIDYDKQFFAWQRGTHGSAAKHYALRQCAEVSGTRDDNENGRDSADKRYSGDDFYINHHGSPSRAAGQPIGPWSAGCGVGDNYQSHEKFMKLMDLDRRYLANRGHLVACCYLNSRKFLFS